MVLQDIVVQTTVLDNIVTACRKTLPYAVAFTVEGSLKISLVTSEIIVIDVNETGEGKFKKRAKKKETINRTEDGITPPVPKRKRGRPRKVNYQEPVSESENDGDIVDNDTSGILGSESEIPDIKLETVEGVKEEVAESSDILNQQAELGMQALQSLAMQLSGEGDASSQPIEPSSSDLPATDQPPSDPLSGELCEGIEEKDTFLEDQASTALKVPRKRRKRNVVEQIHQCCYCGKIFEKRANLRIHERQQHVNTEKTFECKFCDKKFRRNQHLERHQMIHTKEKNYQCSKCEKSFVRLDNLKIHERSHSGEKPYQCLFCGKRFPQKVHMKIHERLHTGETPYSCSYCGKGFHEKNSLTKHERTHTGEKPYKCSHCEKAFSRVEHKKRHEKLHTGEKPHQCRYCGKGFIQKPQMISHERMHTGEKIYKCSTCGAGFGSRTNLNHHIEYDHLPITDTTNYSFQNSTIAFNKCN